MGELSEFATEVKRALARAGLSQVQLSAQMHFARSKISEMCNGRYLPSDETALHMIKVLGMDQDRTLRLLREARAARRLLSTAEPSWDLVLPPEIMALLSAQITAAEDLPYQLPGSRRPSLSTVYVRQDLGSGIEEIRTDQQLPELPSPVRREGRDGREQDWLPEQVERLSGPSTLLTVRAPARTIREALDGDDHLLVTGGPGQGKSTLTLRLTAMIAEVWTGAQDSLPLAEPVVPLRLPARELAARLDLPFQEALARGAAAEYGSMLTTTISPALFTATVSGCRWMLLIDAVDEVTVPNDRQRLLTMLSRWVADDRLYRFVVTSRPLEGAGLAPIQRAAAARYELQPFDKEALGRFAEHWFVSPEQSSRFLAQVRQARLDELIQIPLLATIAAIVFDEHGDRPLPDNKYDLYESYLKYIATARSSPLPDSLNSLRDGLFEHLGRTRVEADTPLIHSAQSWLSQRGATSHLRKILATGPFITRGERLQFLHHSFADHLAAAARARDLPAPFDPAADAWREILHETQHGWGTEHAKDVLVHYTNLHSEHADSLVKWLHHNTSEFQLVAAQLLEQRAPISGTTVDEFLATVWGWAMTTHVRSAEIVRRTTHAAPAWWLVKLMTEPAAPWRSKIEAAASLCIHHPPSLWGNGIQLLREAMNDPDLSVARRVRAATGLARVGVDHYAAVSSALQDCLAHEAIPARTIREAALALADLSPADKELAVTVLKAILADLTSPAANLVHAAAGLAEIGIEFHEQAVAVLTSFPPESPHFELAVLALGTLGPAYVLEAATLFEAAVTDRTLTISTRTRMAAALAKLRPEYGQVAGQHLIGMLADPGADIVEKIVVAETLSKLGNDFGVGPDLRACLASPIADEGAMLHAAKGLAGLSPAAHVEVAEYLRQIYTDPLARPSFRWNSVQELARLGPEYRDEVSALLRGVLSERGADRYSLYRAAGSIAGLGPEYHAEAATALRSVMAGDVSYTDRVSAATTLSGLSTTFHDEAAEVLRAVLTSMNGDVLARCTAASELAVIVPDYREQAAEDMRDLLRNVKSPFFGMVVNELVKLSQHHRIDVAELLLKRLVDPVADSWDLQHVARILTDFGAEFRGKAASTMQQIAENVDGDPSARQTAGMVLAQLGLEFHGQAAAVFTSIMNDEDASVSDRCGAATGLADLCGEHRQGAKGALRQFVEERAAQDFTWRLAGEKLALIDDECHGFVVGAARDVLRDAESSADLRRNAAICLAHLGTGYRHEAVTELAAQMGDHTVQTGGRIDAAWELVQLDLSQCPAVIEYLSSVVYDESAAVRHRVDASRNLVRLDRAQWLPVTGLLRKLSTSALTGPVDRRSAIHGLKRIEGCTAGELSDALMVLATDPAASPDVRHNIAESLSDDDFASRATVLQLHHELLADRMARPCYRVPPGKWWIPEAESAAALQDVANGAEFDNETRTEALVWLARLGSSHRDEAATSLRIRAADRSLSADARTDALDGLGQVAGCRREAVALSRRMIADTSEDRWMRVYSAWVLTRLGAAPGLAAIDSLRAMLDTPATTLLAIAAADHLADFGKRELAVSALRPALYDRGANDHARGRAAEVLAKLSRADRGIAIKTLEALATSSSPNVRWRAVQRLVAVAPECRDKAVEYLRDIMTTAPSARIEAARLLVAVDRTNLERAAAVLREVAKQPRFKRRALFALGELARPYSDEAVIGLRELMGEPDWTTRWRAAEAMAKLRRDLREEASIVAREVANDEKAPWHIRRRAAAGLAKWSAICREEARRILRELDGT